MSIESMSQSPPDAQALTRDLEASVHIPPIARALFHAVTGRHVWTPAEREHFINAAIRAIRAEDEGVRAIAKLEALEVFWRTVQKQIVPMFDYSEAERAFRAALTAYDLRLEHGRLPLRETAAHRAAYDRAIQRDDDSTHPTEELTGHGRY